MTRVSKTYYPFTVGNLVIDGNTISSTTGDINFSTNSTGAININYGGTTVSYGGTGGSAAPIRNPKIITVSLSGAGGDYTSIASAVDNLSGATLSDPYIIQVAPGVYTEPSITMKPYIDIEGSGDITTILAASPTQATVIGCANACIRKLRIDGATGSGGKAISCSNLGSTFPFNVDNILFGSNETQVYLECTSALSVVKVSEVLIGGTYNFTTGFSVTGSNPSQPGILAVDDVSFLDVATPYPVSLFKASGTGSQLAISNVLARITGLTGAAVTVENGGEARVIGCTFRGFDKGVVSLNGGAAPKLQVTGTNLECTTNLQINHTSTSGSFTGYSDYSKISIPYDAPFFVTNTDPRIITIAKKGGDFSSVASAVNSITDSSSSNRYLLKVNPGIYTEPVIDLSLKPYISVYGSAIQSAQIFPDANNHHIFKLGPYNELSFLWLEGTGSGYAGIACENSGDYSQVHKVTFNNCDIGILVSSVDTKTVLYGEYIDMNGDFTYATKILTNPGVTGTAYANLENFYVFPSGNITGVHGLYSSGGGSSFDILASGMLGAAGLPVGHGIHVEDGAQGSISSTYVHGFDVGITNPNVGSGVILKCISVDLSLNNNIDIRVLHPNSSGNFQGIISNHSKVSRSAQNFIYNFMDISGGEFHVTNKLVMEFYDGVTETSTDISTLLLEGGTMGLVEGGEMLDDGGFSLLVESGFGYVDDALSDTIKRFDWVNTNITLPANSAVYIYFTYAGVLSYSTTRPSSEFNILLGRVVTNGTGIEMINDTPAVAHHPGNRFEIFNRDAIGPIYQNGSIVTEGATPFTLDVSGGSYFFGNYHYLPTGGNQISFSQYYQNTSITGGWSVTPNMTGVNNTQYDNGSGTLQSLSNNHFVKHSFYITGDVVYEKYFLVLGQAEYATQIEAEGAAIVTPPSYFDENVTLIANIIIKQGDAAIFQIQDARPVIGFKATGVSASAVHANLLGLSADDHTQYLLVNGGRSMAGVLNMGGNAITGATTVNGITITSHGSRHLPNGSDPLTTDVPVTISTANATGTANSFARSDHVHAHGNQAGGSLHSNATQSTAGFMSNTDKIFSDSIRASSFITTATETSLTGSSVIGSSFFINNSHISSTGAIAESKLNLNFATHSNANDPTTTQKQALTGSYGAPSINNPYVTTTDPRVSITGLAITTPTNNTDYIPYYNTTNSAVQRSLISSFVTLAKATDVTITAPTGPFIDILSYNGSSWVNTPIQKFLPHGEIYYSPAVAASTPIILTTALTRYPVNPVTTLNMHSNFFDMPANGQLRYIGVPSLCFHVALTISFKLSTGTNANIYNYAYVSTDNGVTFNEIMGSQIRNRTSSTLDYVCSAIHTSVKLNTNDRLMMYVSNTTNSGQNIDVGSLNMFAMGMPC